MKKSYIKTNIIGFVIAMVIVSGVAVYAVVTFPSSDVTYENGASGLESTNVQGAIDELYKTCTMTAGDQILEQVALNKDSYECRYYFKGANPNNYITFNDEQAGWRILSVECDGTIKIVKNEVVGQMAFDTSNSNNWARPATLNTYLNETYYNSLTNASQSQIVSHNFGIGGVYDNSDNLSDHVNDENSTKWNGKIGLITTSEFLRVNTNTNSCGNLSLQNRNYKTCNNTNWLSQSYTASGNGWLTLTPDNLYSTIVSTTTISIVYPSSEVSYANANSSIYKIRPTLYLSSDIKITGGDGTESNPYTIE